MNTKEQLEKLKQLQITDANESIFLKHKTLLEWIDKVAPLLKYNNEHYSLFMNTALKVSIPNISSHTAIPCLNIMKSVVNRAITELENDIKSPQDAKKDTLKYPDKITLKWLWTHVPYRFWFVLIGLLITAFSLGITFANTKLYNSFTDLLTANNNINKHILPKNK